MTVVEEKIDTSTSGRKVILSVRNLKTYYPIYGGLFKRRIADVKAVDGVTFNMYEGETLGIVGESGCGKTSIGNTILNLVKPTDGEIIYRNKKLVINKKLHKKQMKEKEKTEVKLTKLQKHEAKAIYYTTEIRKKIQMVFQDPDSSLNPRWKL